jgi:diaminopimelate epimerase
VSRDRGLLLKVEGAGNDFLLGTESWARRLAADTELVTRLCDRRRGIGADGVLSVKRLDEGRINLVHRNADGSGSAFCANGTRCAARAAVDLLGCRSELNVLTGWTEIPARVDEDLVALTLPPSAAPERRVLDSRRGWFMTIGVPHLVLPVEGLSGFDLRTAAGPLRHHPELGPDGANVSFIEIDEEDRLRIRTMERGVDDEVLCCGSGVVAAALIAMNEAGSRSITVLPRSADTLIVEALGEPPTSPSLLRGPARLVAAIDPLD